MKIVLSLLLLAMSLCQGATTATFYNGRMIGAVNPPAPPGVFTNALFVYTAADGGRDDNSGFTTNAPLATGSAACARLTNGVACTVYFENGAILSDTNWLISVIGTASSPIRFTTYGPNPATINFSVRATNSSPAHVWETRDPSGINVSNVQAFTLDNLILNGVGVSLTNGSNGIKLLHADMTTAPSNYYGIVLSNLVVRNWNAGLSWWAISNNYGFTNWSIVNCVFTNNNWIAITMRSLDLPTFADPTGYPVLTNICFHGGQILNTEVGFMYGYPTLGVATVPTMMAVRTFEDLVVSNCWVHDSGTNYTSAGIGGVGIYGVQGKRMLIIDSYVSNIWAAPNPGHRSVDGPGIDIDGQDSMVTRCRIVDCYGPGLQCSYSWGNVHYCFNEIHNCGRGSTTNEPVWAFNFNLNNRDLRVYNNTVVNTKISFPPTPAGGLGCQDDFSNVSFGTHIFANNIIYLYGCTNIIEVGANHTSHWYFVNNAYYDGAWVDKLKFRWGNVDYTGLAAWRAVGGDPMGWVTNGPMSRPEVVDPIITLANMSWASTNCYLSTSSPLWKSSTNLNGFFGITISNDFARNGLTPSSYSVGAFDTNAVPPPSPGQAVPTGLYAEFLPEDVWTNAFNLFLNWKDRKSGNGWLLQSPGGVVGPIINGRSSLSGKLQVGFDGIGSFMTNASFTNFYASNPLDILMVVKDIGTYDGTANTWYFYDGYWSSNRLQLAHQNVSGDTTTNYWLAASGGSVRDSRIVTNIVMTVELVRTNGGLALYTNNILCMTGAATDAESFGMTLGAKFNQAANSFMPMTLLGITMWTNDNRQQAYSAATNYWKGQL